MTGAYFQFVAKVGTISTFHASFSSLLIPQITGEAEDPHTPSHSVPRGQGVFVSHLDDVIEKQIEDGLLRPELRERVSYVLLRKHRHQTTKPIHRSLADIGKAVSSTSSELGHNACSFHASQISNPPPLISQSRDAQTLASLDLSDKCRNQYKTDNAAS